MITGGNEALQMRFTVDGSMIRVTSEDNLSSAARKHVFGFPTMSYIKRGVQPQKMTRGLKF